MAAYEYLCVTCGAVTEVRASYAEKSAGLNPQCRECEGGELRRVFSTVNVGVRSGTAGGTSTLPMTRTGGGCCGGSCGCG
ncbi:MAG: zinc ribbon domain-containing protein [Actinobacteria bacterium]|nr:zinc ribbon domain-containing protein [Actinomycetota bacterium]